jgi:hypothetical protein
LAGREQCQTARRRPPGPPRRVSGARSFHLLRCNESTSSFASSPAPFSSPSPYPPRWCRGGRGAVDRTTSKAASGQMDAAGRDCHSRRA